MHTLTRASRQADERLSAPSRRRQSHREGGAGDCQTHLTTPHRSTLKSCAPAFDIPAPVWQGINNMDSQLAASLGNWTPMDRGRVRDLFSRFCRLTGQLRPSVLQQGADFFALPPSPDAVQLRTDPSRHGLIRRDAVIHNRLLRLVPAQ